MNRRGGGEGYSLDHTAVSPEDIFLSVLLAVPLSLTATRGIYLLLSALS